MNLGAIFVGLALLVLVIPFVVSPFRENNRHKLAPAASIAASPASQREQVILALRDLDFDYQTEKIREDDYARIRAQLLAEAADFIQAEQREDALIEEKIRAHREAASPTQKCQECGRHLRSGDLFCTGCGSKTTVRCQSCGNLNRSDDNFCSKCGTRFGSSIGSK